MGMFEDKGLFPLGLNPASAEKHRAYVKLKDFPFPLLSDPGRKVAKAYGAVKLMGSMIKRAVVVVGRDGKIRYSQEGMPADGEILGSV